MNQQPDLAVDLMRQFTYGSGDLSRDNQIATDFFTGQAFKRLELIFFQAVKISSEISYGSILFSVLTASGRRSRSAPCRRQTLFLL